ncbi:hypothetical protein D3C72_2322780 [compost metagenome]
MVKEERCDVVVEDVEKHVRLVMREPGLDRLEAGEDRRPGRLALLVMIHCKANGRSMGNGETADDACHLYVSRTTE